MDGYPGQCINPLAIFRRSFKERKQTGLGDELAKILTSSPNPNDSHSPQCTIIHIVT